MEHWIGSITEIKTFSPGAGWKGWRKYCFCKRCLPPLGLGSLDQVCKTCAETTQPALLQNSFVQIIFQVQLPLAVTLLLLFNILCMACLAKSLGMLQSFLRAEVASWSGGRQILLHSSKAILNSCLYSLKISIGHRGSKVLEI